MMVVFWLMIILVSAAVSTVTTYPLRRKVEALESMCEMLSKAVRREYAKEDLD